MISKLFFGSCFLLTRIFVGASHQKSLDLPIVLAQSNQCSFLGRGMDFRFSGFFFVCLFAVNTGNINHIMPLCLLLRKNKLESHGSPHCFPACVCEK